MDAAPGSDGIRGTGFVVEAQQRQFKLRSLGAPAIRPAAPMASFGNQKLIGVEIFDNVDVVIASAHDISPVAAEMQARVRDIGLLVRDSEPRKMVDRLIKEEIVPEFLKYAVTRSGVFRNSWLGTLGTGNYGSNYWFRAAANQVGIWANTNDEVVYYVGTLDDGGRPLNGAHDYLLEFSAENRPDAVVNAYWSIILVDLPDK